MNMHLRVIPLDFSGGRFTRDGREVCVVSTLPRTSAAKAAEFRDKEDSAQAKAVGVTTAKLRGFKNPFRVEYQVVNLDALAELYPNGGDVTIADLVAKGAVRKNEKVKVLGNGDIAVKLNIAVDKVSSSAEQKIVAAGGSIK